MLTDARDILAPCAQTGETGTNAIGFAKTVVGRPTKNSWDAQPKA